MKFTIIGAGAIGGVVGAYLAKAGEDVTLVDINEDHINVMKQNGLTIETVESEFNTEVKALTVDELVDRQEPLDVVILAVKAQHTAQAVDSFKSLLTDQSVVISMQNGLTEEVISEKIGQERTIGSFVNLFADYQEPGLIQYGGVGSMYIGELNGETTPRIKEIQQRLLAWGDAQITDNIWGYLWSKLAYGAILTATATVDEKMADIIDPHDNREMFVELASEVLRVAQQLDIEPMPFDNWEPKTVYPGNENRDWEAIHEQFDRLVARLRTYKKVKSGIWRDLAVRKRKTEVPFHLSPVIEQGEACGIDMTLTQKVLDTIIDLEEGRREMSWENIDTLKSLSKQK
ncbi:ketopantoate reductase family protein [Aquisalibacillus elongatus]|uniref:2-dehydropantoate 2-reductase n=1 Tax=Aquisalibacillus elongatus TaxID=485577 RepID=A0A3N5BWU5_9BACI|nr:2-dehydropantoate 2-reductase [Aquisalibacillus elongatus]RPF54228.1 2-dehydropantoate 2-reductase [Aquisalibacillus elongatus]